MISVLVPPVGRRRKMKDEKGKTTVDIMRIYAFGNKEKPELMLLPGNLIEGREYYEEVLPYLLGTFHVILVSYSGFDGNENNIFRNMEIEAEMIEGYVKENYGGKLFALYGSAIGGTFAAFLMQRNEIRFDHVIIGGVDFDKASIPVAFLQSRLFAPIFYKMIHTGEPSSAIAKEMPHLNPKDPYIRQLRLMGVGTGGRAYVKRKSVINMFYSEWTAGLKSQIAVEGTKVHYMHAKKTGDVYLDRVKSVFKDPEIYEYDTKHEELLLRYPKDWAEKIAGILGQELYG